MSSAEPFEPTLKIFLSADIQNSTALKQPRPIDKGVSEKTMTPWLPIAKNFFQNFPVILNEKWVTKRDSFPGNFTHIDNPRLGESPKFWKALGDELVFQQTLTSQHQLYVTVQAFEDAVKDYDKSLKDRVADVDLGLKGTIWLAGFPIRNTEIPLDLDLSEGIVDKNTENISLSEEQAKAIIEHQKREGKGENIDYLGPSIDVGFRLSSMASPRKLTLSVEAANMLARTCSELEKGAEFAFCYDEGQALKGVLNNTRYPHVWIDLQAGVGEPTKMGEALSRTRKPSRVIKEATEEFISQHSSLTLPYILRGGDKVFGEMPPKDAEKVASYRQLYPADDLYHDQEGKNAAKALSEQERAQADQVLSELEKIVAKQIKDELK
jgi:hypothetical protein